MRRLIARSLGAELPHHGGAGSWVARILGADFQSICMDFGDALRIENSGEGRAILNP
jgi:hypothetical protein